MKKTDWDSYYEKPYKTSGFLKGIVTRRLLNVIKKYSPVEKGVSLLEFGGGNSCFYELFDRTFEPSGYYIVDNNQVGLNRFAERIGERPNTHLMNRDILDTAGSGDIQCDIVFSIGLIEHFSPENTRKAILSHFKVLKRGGLLILGFPTPTFLYRITRKISEILGLWMFHDERPITIGEVLETVDGHGCVLEKKIIRAIFLTQAMVVIKKDKKP